MTQCSQSPRPLFAVLDSAAIGSGNGGSGGVHPGSLPPARAGRSPPSSRQSAPSPSPSSVADGVRGSGSGGSSGSGSGGGGGGGGGAQ